MMALFRRFFRVKRVERLIRDGVGVREASWRLESHPAQHTDAIVDDVVRWVRDSMGKMRRPYGIDHVALALAARDDSGKVVCSSSLGVLRPNSFYAEEGADQVRAFIGDASRVMAGRSGEMVGALLSLGDIAFALDCRAA